MLNIQDLTNDKILLHTKRMEFDGKTVPSLGGIPLLRKIGQGGMGAVYVGYRQLLQREVAVKVLPQQVAAQDEQMTERFLREARLAAKIASEHLVAVEDVGEENGISYLVMEYVKGCGASDLLKKEKGGLPEAKALDIAIGATTGLAAAHEAGVVHRDIKPDNILVPYDVNGFPQHAKAKVADLGIARPIDSGGHSLTMARLAIGTPGYMAPEQATDAKTAGKPADVFAMGATLYCLLSGEAPFEGESPTSVLMATLKDPHKPIKKLKADVSMATATILDLCLEKDPAKRPRDAAALLALLKGARGGLSGTPIPAESAEALATLSRTATPRRNLLIAGAAVVVLAAVGWFMMGGDTPTPTNAQAPAAAPVTITVYSGPEKEAVLKEWAKAFNDSPVSNGATVNVKALSLSKTIDAIVDDPKFDVQVWSPSSSMFAADAAIRWKEKHGTELISASTSVARGVLAFVMFKNRHDVFVKKHGPLTFETLSKAFIETPSWESMGGPKEWGDLSVAIPRPSKYAVGALAIASMAAVANSEMTKIEPHDIESETFRKWGRGLTKAFAIESSGEITVRDMVQFGASKYDGIVGYEDTIIDQIAALEDRNGEVVVTYPFVNVWSDHPLCILDGGKSSPAQKKVAQTFVDFCYQPEQQHKLLSEGFRPGNPKVLLGNESLWETYASRGVTKLINIALTDPPSPAIYEALKAESEDWMKKYYKDPKSK